MTHEELERKVEALDAEVSQLKEELRAASSRYCGACGTFLMGGATKHRPGCEIQAIIDSVFGPADTAKVTH